VLSKKTGDTAFKRWLILSRTKPKVDVKLEFKTPRQTASLSIDKRGIDKFTPSATITKSTDIHV